VIAWEEELAQSEAGSVTTNVVGPNTAKYLGMSLRTARVLSAVLAVVLGLLFAYVLRAYLISRPAMLSDAEKEHISITKKYGGRIAEAETAPTGLASVSLTSMADLIKMADELGKPIVHHVSSASAPTHTYYVLDGLTSYRYVLNVNAPGSPATAY
jgi:hypothetical protein